MKVQCGVQTLTAHLPKRKNRRNPANRLQRGACLRSLCSAGSRILQRRRHRLLHQRKLRAARGTYQRAPGLFYMCLERHEVFVDERSEEHTSELQSRLHLVCRLLLEKKKIHTK